MLLNMATGKLLVIGLLLCALVYPPTEACGWNTTALSGTVKSPNFPANYSNGQTCVYVITAPEGYQITINFTDLDLEPNIACSYDFVELRDGDEKSPVIGRHCNTSLPVRTRTFGHQLWIRFVSDGSYTSRGFRFTFVSEKLQAPFFLLASSITGSAIGGNIHRMDVETKTNYIISTSSTLFRPIAVDYDPVDQTIYFTEVGSVRGIRACALNGSGVHSILDAGTGTLMDGLAVDPLSRLLFYTDSSRDLIAMMTLSTKAHKTIISSNMDRPRDIVLNTADGVMFWTDWGAPPKIERANYDGSDRRVLVSIGILLINGLALDVANNRLYWVDAATDQVEMSDMDGNNRTRLFGVDISAGHHFFSVAVLDNTLYFTSWLGGNTANSSIIIRHKIGETNATVYGSTSGRRLNAIHVVQPKLFAANNANGCGNNNGGCDVFCIPLPSNSSKCACPDGQTLGSDKRTCRSGGSSTPPTPVTTPLPTIPMMTAAPITLSSSSFAVVVTTADPQPLDTNGHLDITLTCEASKGIDVTSYAWSVPCAGRTGSTCVFKPRPPEDDGKKVTCTVTSSDGRVGSGEMRVQLNYPPQTAPTINVVSKDTVYKQGQSLTLTCSVNGGKPLVASVLFSCGPHLDNGKDIFGTTEVHSVLTIKALSSEDDRRLCTCTARWKNTAWYKLSDSVQLRVNGTTPEGSPLNIVAIAAGSAGAVVVIIVVIIIIVVMVRRCGAPTYDRPKRKKQSRQEMSNIYSVLGPQRAGGQGQLHSNKAYDGDKISVYDEAEDETNSHYESLDNVAPAVAPADYLTPVSKPQREEVKPLPCSWEKRAPENNYLHPVSEDNYLHPVSDGSKGNPVPSLLPTPN